MDGKVVPAYVGSPSADLKESGIKLLDKSPDGKWTTGSWQWADLTTLKEKIDFGKPDIGMTPDGPTMVYLAYSTPRAPLKGLRTREARVNHFNTNDIRGYINPMGGDRYDWIDFSFNPHFATVDEAWEQINKGEKVGVPLNRFMGIFSTKSERYPLFAYKRWSVGYMPESNRVILNPTYSEYASTISSRLGITVQTI